MALLNTSPCLHFPSLCNENVRLDVRVCFVGLTSNERGWVEGCVCLLDLLPRKGCKVEKRRTGQLHLHYWRFCRRFIGN
jgi:hypothetical protein